MKILLLNILLLSIISTLSAKTTETLPEWTKEQHRMLKYPKEEYFSVYKEVSQLKRRDLVDESVMLRDLLKKQLSQNIYSRVKQEQNLIKSEFVYKDHQRYTERYTSNAIIESDIELPNSNTQTFTDKKDKTIYGFIFVEKKQFASHYKQLLEKEINTLVNQLKNNTTYYSSEATRQLIDTYERKFNVINKYCNIIFTCNENLSGSNSAQITEIRNGIDLLYQNLDMAEFLDKLTKGQLLMSEREYEEAFKVYTQLKLIQPEDERVKYGLKESALFLETTSLSAIELKENTQDFHEAILIYNKLFNLLPVTKDDHLEKYNFLKEQAFSKALKNLKQAIKYDNLSDMNSWLLNLQIYRQIDESTYVRYEDQVNEMNADDLYEKAKVSYYARQYKQSIITLKSALNLNDDYQYRNLLSKCLDKIYKQNIMDLKQTRPHRYSVQLGVGIQHNFDLAGNYLETEQWNTSLYPVYSAAIYRKYKINDRISSNGRDFSKSNIIGFKYTYMNATQQYNFEEGWQEVIAQTIQELEFSLGVSNTSTLSFGLLSRNITLDIIDYPQYYSVTINKRIYALPLEFSLDLKGYFNANEFYPVLKFSSNINFNFKRIIKSHDRKRLRAELKQMSF